MSLNLDRSTWKRVKLGDVVLRSRAQADPLKGDVDRYVAGGHIDTDSVIISRSGDVSDGQMGSTFHYFFKPGQVLFVSARPYLRKTGIPDFAGVVADKTYVLEAVSGNGLIQDMLPFLLTSDRFVEYATQEATGSMNPRLLWGAMQRYEFDLPSLDEQKRIADLLWAVEHEVRAVSRLQLASERAVRLRRCELLSVGELVKASNVFDIEIGRQRSPKFQTGLSPVPYMRSANVKRGAVLTADVLSMDFTPQEVKRFALADGDILVTEGSGSPLEVGAPARWDNGITGPVCFQNTLLRYRAASTDPGWLWQWAQFAFDEGRFREAAAGTGILHIGLKRAREMQVQVPDLETQRKVATLLDTLDNAGAAISARLDRAGTLADSLSREVFGVSG